MDSSKRRNDAEILRYLIKVSTFLSNVRFLASFRRLEESTQWTVSSVLEILLDVQ